MPYLPYEEPAITVILSLTSFILLLNVVRYVFDHLLYCGIIGEILIGIIWGLPVGGTSWLSLSLQNSIQTLGYLGLIGLVFQGGLETNIAVLRKNALVSVSIATVGLSMPIAFSFLLTLLPFPSGEGTAYPTPLAAFSAGASLCSTSLGTTFAILSSANLQKTRVGIVLVGAAMMDDVVGLVMVNIVTTLGNGTSSGWSIARPIVASFGLLLTVLVIAPFPLKHIFALLVRLLGRLEHQDGTESNFFGRCQSCTALVLQNSANSAFIFRMLVLIVFVTIASYINASVLFAAFIAGGLVHYLSDSVTSEGTPADPEHYEQDLLQPLLDCVLLPFFFASIGFSIPLTDMFTASIVWKGIVYTILMIIGKGLVAVVIYFEHIIRNSQSRKSTSIHLAPRNPTAAERTQPETVQHEKVGAPHAAALLVAFAMVARGEIGFLIASLSQSSGTLTLKATGQTPESSGEAVFLVIVWAVVLCTIIGPISVGVIVRRFKGKADNPLLNW